MTSIRGVLVSTGLASGHYNIQQDRIVFYLCAGECVSVRNVLKNCLKWHTYGAKENGIERLYIEEKIRKALLGSYLMS